jgi:hypothetical protein
MHTAHYSPAINCTFVDQFIADCRPERSFFCPAVEQARGLIGACIAAGLVGGEGFAVDASLIVADANKQRSIPGRDDKNRDPETASLAVKEYLATLENGLIYLTGLIVVVMFILSFLGLR